jgi:hypothetical protein
MILFRCLAGCGLLMGAIFLAWTGGRDLPLIALGAGFVLFWVTRRPLSRALLAAMPIAVTAAGYYLLQVLAGNAALILPLRMMVVFLWLSAALAVVPWQAALTRTRPGSPGFHALLYVHLIGHFLHILGEESLCVLRAWKWTSRGTRGSARFQALRGALAALFLRSLGRAERFYAAQLVRGLAE